MTTILSTIITTIPTTIPISIPTTTIQPTVPINIPTTISVSKTIFVPDICKYGVLINYTSSFSNLSNSDIYDYEIKNIINSYCLGGSSVIVKGQNANFQITTTRKEILAINNINNLSGLDLTECESILKGIYNIEEDAELIVLKFIKDDGKTLKYEIFNPDTREQLNLSYCENTKTDVYVPYNMDVKTEQIYNNLKEQGYDPLDLFDKFYREICTPYTSENGTDVLLDDREEFIYSSKKIY